MNGRRGENWAELHSSGQCGRVAGGGGVAAVFPWLYTETAVVQWLSPFRGPHGQVFVRGVEVKATLRDSGKGT
jgi:hypothetical protein